jgi:hypothetical protein
MLKASFNLPNGTLVTIEGIPEDVRNLLDYYSNSHLLPESKPPKDKPSTKHPQQDATPNISKGVTPDTLAQVVNLIKSCPEAEAIEEFILDKEKSSEANRVLLPLYIIHEYLDNAFDLTTVEISKITTDLGPNVKVRRQNVLRALARSSASKYVLGDKTREIGTATRYKLNDRGVQYIKSILANEPPKK